MVHQYKIPIKKVEDAMIEVKEGMPIMLKLKKGDLISAVITKVEKDFVIATKKDNYEENQPESELIEGNLNLKCH